jgi:UDP-GlcNAc:undecaprenyl-phosphate/decaprenyl-phosphate GlcNAc-1-phosphate transferase
MILAFSFISALFITMVLVPPLMRLARPLHLLDIPDARKIHTDIVPRCGGLAIASGIVLPILMWLPKDAAMWAVLTGGLVVFLFGLWDDIKDLDYRVKLLGQIAALAFAINGGVVLEHYPFCGLDPVSVWLAYPATALIVLGVTNAINLTDGLDGLAAGCTLLTLAMIAFLAYQSNNSAVLMLALTVMGGVLGFLRYNTHPAIVFLGDAGSQFLGFITAALTIFLVERVNQALSPALPLLLLGLPILDTLWVFTLRVAAGRSPFSPDRKHIHHQLLDLGFRQYEAVSLIYLLHGGLICAGFYLRYESDVLVASVYVVFCLVLVASIALAKAAGWRLHAETATGDPEVERRISWLRRIPWLPDAVSFTLTISIVVFLIAGALIVGRLQRDFVVVALASVVALIAGSLLLRGSQRWLSRAGVYMSSVMIVFMLAERVGSPWINDLTINVLLLFMSAVLVVGIRTTRRDLFRVTPQDLLIVFFALVVPNLTSNYIARYPMGEILFRLLVLFYVTEFLLNKDSADRQNAGKAKRMTLYINRLLRYSAVVCLILLVVQGDRLW